MEVRPCKGSAPQGTQKYHVDIKAIDRKNYSIYTQNPNEVFVNGMFELLDVYERQEIALKLKRGRFQKAKSGAMRAALPLGTTAPMAAQS